MSSVAADNTDGPVEHDPTGRFHRYKTVLGRGAFKTVYMAFDNQEALEVAWNKLNIERLNPDVRNKLENEVNFLKKLDHQNIIKLYASFKLTAPDGRESIDFITELMMSGTLKDYLKKAKVVKLKVIRRWCANILAAIAYLHKEGIMHRDLKLENLFVNGHVGEVKIGDFGLSAVIAAEKAESVIGTPEFMAPELYEESYTEKVDVYAFGMCLLEMVSMDYPYSECKGPAQIMLKAVNNEKPAALQKLVDGDVKNVIVQCLMREPDRPSAEELRQHPLFRDWASDDGTRSNLSLIKGTPESSSVDPSPELAPGEDLTVGAKVIAFSENLNRDIYVAMEGRTERNEERTGEPGVVIEQPIEGPTFRIGITIPIQDLGVKLIEFTISETDKPRVVAEEMVAEFRLDPQMVPELTREIEEQLLVLQEQRDREQQLLEPSLEHPVSASSVAPVNASIVSSTARSVASGMAIGSVAHGQLTHSREDGPSSSSTQARNDLQVPTLAHSKDKTNAFIQSKHLKNSQPQHPSVGVSVSQGQPVITAGEPLQTAFHTEHTTLDPSGPSVVSTGHQALNMQARPSDFGVSQASSSIGRELVQVETYRGVPPVLSQASSFDLSAAPTATAQLPISGRSLPSLVQPVVDTSYVPGIQVATLHSGTPLQADYSHVGVTAVPSSVSSMEGIEGLPQLPISSSTLQGKIASDDVLVAHDVLAPTGNVANPWCGTQTDVRTAQTRNLALNPITKSDVATTGYTIQVVGGPSVPSGTQAAGVAGTEPIVQQLPIAPLVPLSPQASEEITGRGVIPTTSSKNSYPNHNGSAVDVKKISHAPDSSVSRRSPVAQTGPGPAPSSRPIVVVGADRSISSIPLVPTSGSRVDIIPINSNNTPGGGLPVPSHVLVGTLVSESSTLRHPIPSIQTGSRIVPSDPVVSIVPTSDSGSMMRLGSDATTKEDVARLQLGSSQSGSGDLVRPTADGASENTNATDASGNQAHLGTVPLQYTHHGSLPDVSSMSQTGLDIRTTSQRSLYSEDSLSQASSGVSPSLAQPSVPSTLTVVPGNEAEQQRFYLLCLEMMDNVAKGRVAIVKQKLSQGASVTFADYDKRTPLHLAAGFGDIAVCELLLSHGANVNARDRWGRTPLDDARMQNRDGVAELLLKAGAEDTEDVEDLAGIKMLQACANGQLDVVRELLASNTPVTYMDYEGRTALHVACSHGHADIVDLLLLNRADALVTDRRNRTAVDNAVRNGHRNVLEVLKRNGVDLTVQNVGSDVKNLSLSPKRPIQILRGSTVGEHDSMSGGLSSEKNIHGEVFNSLSSRPKSSPPLDHIAEQLDSMRSAVAISHSVSMGDIVIGSDGFALPRVTSSPPVPPAMSADMPSQVTSQPLPPVRFNLPENEFGEEKARLLEEWQEKRKRLDLEVQMKLDMLQPPHGEVSSGRNVESLVLSSSKVSEARGVSQTLQSNLAPSIKSTTSHQADALLSMPSLTDSETQRQVDGIAGLTLRLREPESVTGGFHVLPLPLSGGRSNLPAPVYSSDFLQNEEAQAQSSIVGNGVVPIVAISRETSSERPAGLADAVPGTGSSSVSSVPQPSPSLYSSEEVLVATPVLELDNRKLGSQNMSKFIPENMTGNFKEEGVKLAGGKDVTNGSNGKNTEKGAEMVDICGAGFENKEMGGDGSGAAGAR